MADNVYIVVASCGEYSHAEEWWAGAYLDEGIAIAHAEKAKKWAIEDETGDRSKNPYDKRMSIFCGFRDIEYTVEPIGLNSRLPDEAGK